MDLLTNGGRYRARARFWKLGETSTQKEQVAVEFELTLPDGSKTPRTWFGFFTDSALETTLKALRACGWKGQDPLELDTPQAGLDANEVEVEIEHETYKEKTRDRIRWVNPLGGAGVNGVTPLAPEKRASFATRMKGAILALEAGRPRPAPARPNGGPPPSPADNAPGPDDVPF